MPMHSRRTRQVVHDCDLSTLPAIQEEGGSRNFHRIPFRYTPFLNHESTSRLLTTIGPRLLKQHTLAMVDFVQCLRVSRVSYDHAKDEACHRLFSMSRNVVCSMCAQAVGTLGIRRDVGSHVAVKQPVAGSRRRPVNSRSRSGEHELGDCEADVFSSIGRVPDPVALRERAEMEAVQVHWMHAIRGVDESPANRVADLVIETF